MQNYITVQMIGNLYMSIIDLIQIYIYLLTDYDPEFFSNDNIQSIENTI